MSQLDKTSKSDADFRRMMMWVVIVLIATLALAVVVVELTLWWFNGWDTQD